MKLALIGNCQMTALGAVVTAHFPDWTCDVLQIHKMTTAQCNALRGRLHEYDAVVSHVFFNEAFGDMLHARLTQRRPGDPRLLFVHGFYYSPVVPDCIYLRRDGVVLRSPVANYHSQIVRDAFLEGCSEADCARRVRAGEGVDVADTHARAMLQMSRRERALDVPFAEELEALVKQAPQFHVMNHPRITLVTSYATRILSAVLDDPALVLDRPVRDPLEKFGSWPTHGWVADALGLTYRSETFVRPDRPGGPRFSIEEFVSDCYQLYRDYTLVAA